MSLTLNSSLIYCHCFPGRELTFPLVALDKVPGGTRIQITNTSKKKKSNFSIIKDTFSQSELCASMDSLSSVSVFLFLLYFFP